jgi:polysaccharide biosynthesis protein PslH
MGAEILFLAHRVPYPPDRGDKIRSWNILRHIAGFARVHLGCFADDAADAAHLSALRAALGDALGEVHVAPRRTGRAAAGLRALVAGKPVSLTAFGSRPLADFAARIAARADAVFVFSGQMAQFVPAGARFVMDFVDVDSAKFEAYAREGGPSPMRWVNRREAVRLGDFERSVAARAQSCLFVSEAEAALFRARTGAANVVALSNGIDLDAFRPGAVAPAAEAKGEGPLAVFTGQMDYPPNILAAAAFVRDVLPRLEGLRFAIVGRAPTAEVRRLAGPRVQVTGAVPDVRAWLEAADLAVAPLTIARGIQNKVLEAMAMGRPVVASSAAFEGIEAEPGRDLIVADGGAETAEAIRALFAAPERAAALGASARACVEARYRWDVRLAPLRAILLGAGRAAA